MALLLLFLFHLLIPLQASCLEEVCTFIVSCYQEENLDHFVNVSSDTFEVVQLRGNCSSLSTVSKMTILPDSAQSWNLSFSTIHKNWSIDFAFPSGSSLRLPDTEYLNGSDIDITRLESKPQADPSLPDSVSYSMSSKNLLTNFNESTMIVSIDGQDSEPISFDPILNSIEARMHDINGSEEGGIDWNTGSTANYSGPLDPIAQSGVEGEKKEEKREEGVWHWVGNHLIYFAIGGAVFLIAVIALIVTLCILCSRRKKRGPKSKMKPSSAMSFQRLSAEASVHKQEDTPSISTSSDIKPGRDEGSTIAEPSKTLIAKSEASRTGDVTETEQRLERILTAK